MKVIGSALRICKGREDRDEGLNVLLPREINLLTLNCVYTLKVYTINSLFILYIVPPLNSVYMPKAHNKYKIYTTGADNLFNSVFRGPSERFFSTGQNLYHNPAQKIQRF